MRRWHCIVGREIATVIESRRTVVSPSLSTSAASVPNSDRKRPSDGWARLVKRPVTESMRCGIESTRAAVPRPKGPRTVTPPVVTMFAGGTAVVTDFSTLGDSIELGPERSELTSNAVTA